MFNMTYDQIVSVILEKSTLSKPELEKRINEKLKQLSDLVTREGAAHIIANELNIKLADSTSKDLKIKDILPGMRLININAKVINIYETREFQRNGNRGILKSLLVGDETGTTRIVIWDEKIISRINELKENDIIGIKGAYCKENNAFKELHLGSSSQININPKGVEIGDIRVRRESPKKKISELIENDYVELTGTIIQTFEPKTFEICPLCNKKVSYQDEKYVCDEHGVMESKSVPLINFFLDDGTGDIKVVAFREQAEKIMNKTVDQIKEMKATPERLDLLKSSLLGKQFSMKGKVTMNMFNRLEFIANEVEEIGKVEMESVV